MIFRIDYFLHKKNIKDVDVLMEWIKNLIPQVAYDIAKGDEYNGVGFDINAFTIQESWGIHYNDCLLYTSPSPRDS